MYIRVIYRRVLDTGVRYIRGVLMYVISNTYICVITRIYCFPYISYTYIRILIRLYVLLYIIFVS